MFFMYGHDASTVGEAFRDAAVLIGALDRPISTRSTNLRKFVAFKPDGGIVRRVTAHGRVPTTLKTLRCVIRVIANELSFP